MFQLKLSCSTVIFYRGFEEPDATRLPNFLGCKGYSSNPMQARGTRVSACRKESKHHLNLLPSFSSCNISFHPPLQDFPIHFHCQTENYIRTDWSSKSVRFFPPWNLSETASLMMSMVALCRNLFPSRVTLHFCSIWFKTETGVRLFKNVSHIFSVFFVALL